MIKKVILAVITVFIVWSVLDFLIHGVLLHSTYMATADLWRPMEEMSMTLGFAITLVVSVCFVAIYSIMVANKSLTQGLIFGALLGLLSGIPMGFGSYIYIPIPLSLAISWFLGSFVEFIAAGAVVGLIIKSEKRNPDIKSE